MIISTKVPPSLKWVAFSVFLLVILTTHNLSAGHSPPDGPPDPDEFYIEVGSCYTPNFGGVPDSLSNLVEYLNPLWSIRHEEAYAARTDGYHPSDLELDAYWQRGFYNAIDAGSAQYIFHVSSYIYGLIVYVPGWMIENTHDPAVQELYDLQKRFCTMVYQAPEDHLVEEVKAGVSFRDPHFAHIRYLEFGWDYRDYHLFLQNCQHWTDYVIHGVDNSGIGNLQNMFGFGFALWAPEALIRLLRTLFPGWI
ncbi:MAG: hypothetical protein OXH31_07020 [Gammaproteobacteria bacterium]|nr:hypothetical protein [Gammaproteobacteria bacterium]